jgi:alpha-galactosidase
MTGRANLEMNSKSYDGRLAARQLATRPDREGLPEPSAWDSAPSVAFCRDWQGQNPDPERETEARLLWSSERLFIRFRCRYRTLYVYEGQTGRRDQLWLRDVAEVFIRPAEADIRHYREFEVSPNGDWLDLDIFPGGKSILSCDLKIRVSVDPSAGIWTAELAIPMNCLTLRLDPGQIWHINLFRIEGPAPDRYYSSWRPTHTPKPNFHVPERFGELCFQ